MKHKHWILMALGCIIMLVLAFTLPRTGIVGLGGLAILICPLIHLLMLVGIFGGKHKGCCHSDTDAEKSNG